MRKRLTNIVNESARRSLSRIAAHVANRSFGIITAHRSELHSEVNKARNNQLKGDIKAHGLSFIPIRGRYIENYGKENQRPPSDEKSFMVMGRHSEHDNVVKNFLTRHGEKYGQDSVLFKPNGTKRAHLIGTNETGFPGKGNVHDVGEFHPGRAAEFHSLLTRGGGKPGRTPAIKRTFAFESEQFAFQNGDDLCLASFVNEISYSARNEHWF